MRILLLADPKSTHTQKWVKSLAENVEEILLFGLGKYDPTIYEEYPNIIVNSVGLDQSTIRGNRAFGKLHYLKVLPMLKRLIREFRPDIVHAHFASSYGLLGALSGFHPYIISVWGSDIFDFPKKSLIHKKIIQFNLAKADKILSTSQAMAEETQKYTNSTVTVTPFGIDLEEFKPNHGVKEIDKETMIVGTIKSLEEVYGIEYLIHAVALLKKKHINIHIKLLIVGGGGLEQKLKRMSRDLGLENETVFIGRVSYDQVPYYHNQMDIEVYPSLSESFGVAVIEAGACEKPVVVTRVGGLPEVVEDGVTGIIVDPKNPVQIAEAIETLILNDELRVAMGKNGRERVKRLYNWEENVKQMIEIYNQIKI